MLLLSITSRSFFNFNLVVDLYNSSPSRNICELDSRTSIDKIVLRVTPRSLVLLVCSAVIRGCCCCTHFHLLHKYVVVVILLVNFLIENFITRAVLISPHGLVALIPLCDAYPSHHTLTGLINQRDEWISLSIV